VWQAAVDERHDYPEALLALGRSLAVVGSRRMKLAEALSDLNQQTESDKARRAATEEFRRAQDALERLLQIRPDDPGARQGLLFLRQQAAAARTRPGGGGPGR
jgi:hypothetical protein